MLSLSEEKRVDVTDFVSSPYVTTILSLPMDVLVNCILNRVTPPDLVVCYMTCRTLRNASKQRWKASSSMHLYWPRLESVGRDMMDFTYTHNRRAQAEWWLKSECHQHGGCNGKCRNTLVLLLLRGWVDLAAYLLDAENLHGKYTCLRQIKAERLTRTVDPFLKAAVGSKEWPAIKLCLDHGSIWNCEYANNGTNVLSVDAFRQLKKHGYSINAETIWEKAFVHDRADLLEWILDEDWWAFPISDDPIEYIERSLVNGALECFKWTVARFRVEERDDLQMTTWINEFNISSHSFERIFIWIRARPNLCKKVDWNEIVMYLLRETNGSFDEFSKCIPLYLPDDILRWDYKLYAHVEATLPDDALDTLIRTSKSDDFRRAMGQLPALQQKHNETIGWRYDESYHVKCERIYRHWFGNGSDQ